MKTLVIILLVVMSAMAIIQSRMADEIVGLSIEAEQIRDQIHKEAMYNHLKNFNESN